MAKNVILVTGMSGAGKTSATAIFEDLGYYCIDQLPAQLVKQFVKMLFEENDKRYENLVLSTNSQDYKTFLTYFESREMNVRIVFLDASDEELLLRYRFTRRMHPYILEGKATTIEEAIDLERDIFESISYRKVVRIDTSKLTTKELRETLESKFNFDEKDDFVISFVSFGYKHGVPLDVDLMFDMRFLPNPYWEESLRKLTGDDEAVYKYVIDKEITQNYLKELIHFLDYSFTQYKNEGKNYLMVGIGCTGGQHRSVSVVNYLYDYYRDQYACHKAHRDKKEAL